MDRERHWEPSFPERYLQTDNASRYPPPAEISLASLTSATDDSTLTTSTDKKPTQSTMIRNMAYNEALFANYKAMGIRSQKLKDALKDRKVQLPLNSKGKRMCLPYHVLGFCNSRCGGSDDHADHTPKEDGELSAWCKDNYKLE
jgi:hypothetical protein